MHTTTGAGRGDATSHQPAGRAGPPLAAAAAGETSTASTLAPLALYTPRTHNKGGYAGGVLALVAAVGYNAVLLAASGSCAPCARMLERMLAAGCRLEAGG